MKTHFDYNPESTEKAACGKSKEKIEPENITNHAAIVDCIKCVKAIEAGLVPEDVAEESEPVVESFVEEEPARKPVVEEVSNLSKIADILLEVDVDSKGLNRIKRIDLLANTFVSKGIFAAGEFRFAKDLAVRISDASDKI